MCKCFFFFPMWQKQKCFFFVYIYIHTHTHTSYLYTHSLEKHTDIVITLFKSLLVFHCIRSFIHVSILSPNLVCLYIPHPSGISGDNWVNLLLNPRNIRIPRYYRLSVRTGSNCPHDRHQERGPLFFLSISKVIFPLLLRNYSEGHWHVRWAE